MNNVNAGTCLRPGDSLCPLSLQDRVIWYYSVSVAFGHQPLAFRFALRLHAETYARDRPSPR